MNNKDNPLEILYGLNDKPPLPETVFAALQHLMAIFVPIMTPALIISGALCLDRETASHLISLSLFISGISTFIQVRRFGPVGSGLLSIQGTSFSFIEPLIAAGHGGGLPLMFGICLAGSPIEMILSRFLKYLRKVITPVVSGSVVILIGLSLVKAGMIELGGGQQALKDGTFGTFQHLLPGLLVLLTIVGLNRTRNRYLRMSSILIALVLGLLVSRILGGGDFPALPEAGIITVPVPLKYGLDFNFSAFIPIGLIYLITIIESVGDLTATSMISGEPVKGELYMKRISGGVMGDGVNCLLASFFNSFPNTTFGQNNGIIQLTGVASRYVGYFIAGFLVVLGLFPLVGNFFALLPSAVLGGATLLMFGAVAAAGVKIIHQSEMDRYDMLIVAVSLSTGLGVELVPDIISHLPHALQPVFKSGITTGGIFAIVTQLFYLGKSA